MLSGVQGGGVAVGGLRPGDGAHQQTDRRIQSFPVQGGEPAFHQRVSASKIRIVPLGLISPFINSIIWRGCCVIVGTGVA